MAAYRYSYQKIVDLKRNEKTQAEWVLSAAIGKLQTEEMSLDQLRREHSGWMDRLQQSAESSVPLAEIRMIQEYAAYLEHCIERKLKDVEAAHTEVQHSRSSLSERMMDEKVWIKAKEKAIEKMRQMMLSKEQQELDEIAASRFIFSAQ